MDRREARYGGLSRRFLYVSVMISRYGLSLTPAASMSKLSMSLAESQSQIVARTMNTVPFPVIPTDKSNPTQRSACAVMLPHLSIDEEIRLGKVGSVERQRRRQRIGDAFIVVDSSLPFDQIWDTLLKVSSWSSLMRGVKTSRIHTTSKSNNKVINNAPTELRAGFTVTKLRIPANLVLKPSDLSHTITFELDKSRTNLALDSLQGFWHIEPSPNGEGLTRVWLAASVQACAVVPSVAIDYVASKALRRATKWLCTDQRRTSKDDKYRV